MKIRTGFVSNSSTSSFLIYGTTISHDESESLEDKWQQVRKQGLEIHHPDYSDRYIGASWDSVKDNETGKQFKERIESLISSLLGRPAKCSTHEEAWHD